MNVVFLGSTSDYPLKFSASNTKIQLIARGFVERDKSALIINSILGSCNQDVEIHDKDEFGIEYILFNKRKDNLLFTAFNNLHKIRHLLKLRSKKYEKNIIIYDYEYFPIYILTRMFMFGLGYHWSSIYHENRNYIKQQNILKRLSAYLYQTVFGYLSNSILPISLYLENQAGHFKKPMFRLPIIADFSEDVKIEDEVLGYYCYVTHAGYKSGLSLVLEAFSNYKAADGKFKLILVVYGDNQSVISCKSMIEDKALNGNVFIYQDITTDELKLLLKSSRANFAPLFSNSLQDKARFSQKIAEYLSTGRPIITNLVGEVRHYFDKTNALLFESANPKSLSNLLLNIESKGREIAMIGKAGYKIGQESFNYQVVTDNLINFYNDTI